MSIPGTPLLEITDLADRCGKARRSGFPAHRLPRSLLPLVSLCLSLLQYTVAPSYPSLEDKLQSVIAQGVQLLLAILLTPALALFLAVPLSLGATPAPACLLFAAGCGPGTLLLWCAATRAYQAYPPDGTSTLPMKTSAKRLLRPLLIVAVLLGLGVTGGLRVNKSLHKPPPPPRTVLTHLGDVVIQVSETGTMSRWTKWTSRARRRAACSPSPFRKGSMSRRASSSPSWTAR